MQPLPARLLLIPALCAYLAACAAADPEMERDPDIVPVADRYGGIGVVAVSDADLTLNPLTAHRELERAVMRDLLFLPLVRYDRSHSALPALAERWDTVRVSADTLAVTFHLRADVRWHDGEPTTAGDVIFTFERIFQPGSVHPNAADFAGYRPEVVRVSAHVVRFHVHAYPGFLEDFARLPIAPRHLLNPIVPADLPMHPFGRTPVGNGPFRFLRRLTNSEIVFEANHAHPMALGGRSYLDRLVLREFSEAIPRQAGLMSGSVHVALAEQREFDIFADRRGFRIVESPQLTMVWLVWNPRVPPFQAVEVRRALGAMIDREGLARLYGPGTVVGHTTVLPADARLDREGAAPGFDSIGGRRMLAAAGWSDRFADGVLRDEAGAPLSFSVHVTGCARSSTDVTARALLAQLQRVGVDASFGSGGARGALSSDTSWQAVLYTTSGRPPGRGVCEFGPRSEGLRKAWNGLPHLRVDALLDGLGSVMDREAAIPYWQEYQRLETEHAPVAVLFHSGPLHVVSTRLNGVVPGAFSIFGNAAEWWLVP
jgi:peptide/nickel transport system substrate-binding protein